MSISADEKTDDLWNQLQGRLLAMESMLSHIVWRWALSEPHPPTALSRYLRPLEEKIADMRADPANNKVAMDAAHETIRGIGLALEDALQKEALNRAQVEPKGN